MEPVAFTFRNSRLTAELMTPCGVGAAQLSSEPFSVTGFVQYNALWDTGATASVISTEVVRQLGLAPISQCKTYHAQGVGMDIINLGDFALTHKNSQTVFSFQIPSTHEYDFVKQIDQGVGQKKAKKKR